jgi:ABC-type nitrate/sulfonate/bicarbonate transport system permease component
MENCKTGDCFYKLLEFLYLPAGLGLIYGLQHYVSPGPFFKHGGYSMATMAVGFLLAIVVGLYCSPLRQVPG